MEYKKIVCVICKQQISVSGAAFTSHMRCHVRNAEAIELKHGKKLFFARPDFNITDSEPYAKIGAEPFPGQPKGVWDITDSFKELVAIDPSSYYITSGEAVRKADKLVQDVYALAAKCRSFRDKLKNMKGDKKYLETCREAGRLLVKQKESRGSNINSENEK